MNYQLFLMVNQWAGRYAWLDRGMVFITNYSPVIFAGLLALLWFSNKQNRQSRLREKSQRTALYAAFSATIALSFNQLINAVYWHPRPFVDHVVHQLVPHSAAESSFASDHTILAFAVASMLMLRKHYLRHVALLLAVLTAVSRIFVGVHYPADVIGGAVIAFAASILVIRAASLIEPIVQLAFRVYAKLTMRIPLLNKYSVINDQSAKIREELL